MPSHQEDTRLISDIMHTINTQITAYPNHTHTLCEDFNIDIVLIDMQKEHDTTPPHKKRILGGEYIPIICYFPIFLPIQHTPNKVDSTIQTLA